MLSMTLGTSTLGLCPEGSQSEQFLGYLGQSIAFAFEEGRLGIVLNANDGTAGLLFDPAGGAEGETAMGGASAAAESGLSVDALRNATYTFDLYDAPITLTDGHWEGEPYGEGDASRPMVDYMEESARFGDLDGDGVEDAVLFLTESGGGSGSFVYAAAQLNRDGQPADAGTVLLEDRVQIKSAAIEDGQILVEAIVPGPGDGACCPSHKANEVYALQDGKLAEVTAAGGEPVRISAAALDGTAWTLIQLADGRPVKEGTEITIWFEEGAISGTAGCNDYASAYTLSADNPFLITLEPVTATRMACPAPVMAQEAAYLGALETVTIWGYRFGDLVLRYTAADGSPALLFFAPAAGMAPSAAGG